ncbi:MAG: LytTR family transcriptional regulator DNA-binding domain-containing protein [Bacteroidales bacterium]|nr:LytTR family transcriptional regulator DNA-binding domain-containing protein [Bacteroidales bacterium]
MGEFICERDKLDILIKALETYGTGNYKRRFILHLNSKIIIVEQKDIAYFLSKDKMCHLYTKKGNVYVMDNSLDSVMKDLDLKRFYRISRNCCVAIDSIAEIQKYYGNRLLIIVRPSYNDDIITVSRDMRKDFLRWLEGN